MIQQYICIFSLFWRIKLLACLLVTDTDGLTENDGHDNDGPSKLQAMKLTDQVAGHEIAGHEFARHKNARHEIAGHENIRLEIAEQKI